MYKQTFQQRIAMIVLLALLFCCWGNVALAEEAPSSAGNISVATSDNMQSIDENETVMPMDITTGSGTWCLLQKNATAYYAPYGTGCAVAKSFTKGQGVYVLSRDYDCYYVYWYESGKENYGYITMSALNPPSYIWTQYDIYEKATCSATTQVLAGAGTTNTYKNIGEIYSGESPLMVLGKKVNSYNGVTYYMVQYETTSGFAKRGWVDASLGTVTYSAWSGVAQYEDQTENYYIVNKSTGLCLGWSSVTNDLTFTRMNGLTHQAFKILNVKNGNGRNNGYYQIVPASNQNLALRVSDTGYANGLSIDVATKSNTDKRQEFRLEIYHSTNNDEGELRFYTTFATRSTGEHRSLDIVNGKLVQSTTNHADSSQLWEIYREEDVWGGTYGLYGGSAHPGNYKVNVDPSILTEISLPEIQTCLDQWNSQDGRFSIQAVNGGQFNNNRLTTLANRSLNELMDYQNTLTGMFAPEFRNVNGGFDEIFEPTKSQLNGDWYSSKTYIDLNKIRQNYPEDDEFKREVLITIIHEIGHTLKLSHTYRHLNVENANAVGSQTVKWFETTVSTSLMNTEASASGYDYLLPIDIRRFVDKWENVQ